MIERGLQSNEVQALGSYVRRPAYKAALIAGGPRYDLDGNPHGEVTAEQIAAAKAEWNEPQSTNAEASRRARTEREAKATSRLSLADLKAAARARKAAERAA
jgi:sRNA-binding protein